MRSRGPRRVHPVVLRGGLRGPSGVHRTRDPAHLARLGDPADDLPGPRRRRPLPLRRPARRATGRRRGAPARGARCLRHGGRGARPAPWARTPAHGIRHDAGPAAARPAAGADGDRGRAARLHARGARRRRGAVDPGPARAAGRQGGPGRPVARPVQGRAVRLRDAAHPVALPQGAAEGAVAQRVPTDVQGRVPALPADPRVAGPARPAPLRVPLGAHRPRRRDLRARRGARLGHHPQGAARRAALARRRPRRGQARVRRGARCALRHQSRFGPVPQAAGPGHGRRARRDQPALGPGQRRDRARVGRGGRRPRRGPHRERAALEPQGRCRRRDRAGHPLRRAARHRPHDPVRPRRPGGGPRDLRALGPGRGRLGAAARLLEAQRRHPRPCRRARGARQATRHRRRRRGAVRVLRQPDPARRAHRAALRPLVARRTATPPRPAHPHRGRPHVRGGRRSPPPTTRAPGGRATSTSRSPTSSRPARPPTGSPCTSRWQCSTG